MILRIDNALAYVVMYRSSPSQPLYGPATVFCALRRKEVKRPMDTQRPDP